MGRSALKIEGSSRFWQYCNYPLAVNEIERMRVKRMNSIQIGYGNWNIEGAIV